jgi:hypothetical protein
MEDDKEDGQLVRIHNAAKDETPQGPELTGAPPRGDDLLIGARAALVGYRPRPRGCTMNRMLIGGLLMSVSWAAFGQGVAADVVAAPDVYKTRAENDKYRIVEGTWKPGQRDEFHSHSALLSYSLTPCLVRIHFPDGSRQEVTFVANQASSQGAIASHSVENIGSADCKVLMFEAK